MLTRIGVIGDTHGRVHERVGEVFAGVERIIHTGDVGGVHVLDALEQIAPVTGVRGNYDTEPEVQARLLPDPSALVVGGLQAFLTHRLIVLEWTTYKHLIAETLVAKGFAPRLFLFGHTHCPVLEQIQGIWFVNPGYAGPDPLEGPSTVAIIEVVDGEIRGSIVPLG